MEAHNPYQSPKSEVAELTEGFQPVRVFSTSGRIGRVRYIAYSVGLTFLIGLLSGIVSALLGVKSGGGGQLLFVITWGLILVVALMLTIQRCHDFNTTGWLSLLALIPLVNLIFWFIPGTDGPNRFGLKTPPNSVFTVAVACIVPALFVIGIVAAIAIPAYVDYAKRAATQGPR